MLMGGTILGPGTIFLMLVGAFVAVFHIDNWTSFYYNIIPIVLFVFVCFTCKSNIQVNHVNYYGGLIERVPPRVSTTKIDIESKTTDLVKILTIRLCVFSPYPGRFLARVRANPVGHIRAGDDGRHRRYGAAAGRGRHRIAIRDIFNRNDGLVHNSGAAPSARVFVHHLLRYLLAVDPVHVSALDTVLDHQSQHRHVGYERGASEADQKGNGGGEKGGRGGQEEEQTEVHARILAKLGTERRQRGGLV